MHLRGILLATAGGVAALVGRTLADGRSVAAARLPSGALRMVDHAARANAQALFTPGPGVVIIPALACAGTGAILLAVWLSERHARPARGRRPYLAAQGATVDVVSPAGTSRLALAREHARAVRGADGAMVAQVLWSHDMAWCATATWPHNLYGADGRPCRTLALRPGEWVRVSDVRLRLHAGTAGREPLSHAASD